MDPKKSIMDTLRKVPLFSDASKKEIEFIFRILHQRTYLPGETVFNEEEAGCGMYIIEKGAIRIHARSGDKVKADKEIEFAVLQSGEFFGELALVTSSPRNASATAIEKSSLFGFFQPDLLELIDRNPRLGSRILMQLSSVLGKRLEAMNHRNRMLHSQTQLSVPDWNTAGQPVNQIS